MRYLYTNLQLGWILDRNNDGKIDWTVCGFSVRTVQRYMAKGKCQGETSEHGFVSLIPITDEAKVTSVVLPHAEEVMEAGEFCRIIEQEEADLIAASFVS